MPAGASLFIVAPGNDFVRQNNPAYFVDANTGLADGQVLVSFTVSGALNGTLTILYAGTPGWSAPRRPGP